MQNNYQQRSQRQSQGKANKAVAAKENQMVLNSQEFIPEKFKLVHVQETAG